MKEIFSATASCSPTGLPHCTRSADHSRAIFSAPLAGGRAHRRDRQPPGVERGQRDLETLALLAEPVLDRHPHLVEAGDAVLDALQAHEVVAVLDRDARGVGLDDERGDAAAAAVVLGHLRHHDEQLGDHAVGGPELDPVEQVRRAVLGRRRRACPSRAGSEPTSGSVSRNARDRALRRSAAGTAASAPRCRTSSPAPGTPIDWCADSSAPMLGCTEPGEHQRLAVVGHGQPEAAVLRGIFMPKAPSSASAVDVLVGDRGLALDRAAVERLADLAQLGQERLAARDVVGLGARVRVDQVEVEPAEVELLGEARPRPRRSRAPPRRPLAPRARSPRGGCCWGSPSRCSRVTFQSATSITTR